MFLLQGSFSPVLIFLTYSIYNRYITTVDSQARITAQKYLIWVTGTLTVQDLGSCLILLHCPSISFPLNSYQLLFLFFIIILLKPPFLRFLLPGYCTPQLSSIFSSLSLKRVFNSLSSLPAFSWASRSNYCQPPLPLSSPPSLLLVCWVGEEE